jgi:non-ribosomal peptide synthetase component F
LPETRHGLASCSGRAVPYPTDRTVVQLFEDQARSAPDRPALSWGGTELSYGDLDRLAGALAHRLRAHGVARGDFVPLVMDGGPALPVAMVAAMKAAAPFVPIDQAWPRERIRGTVGQLRPPLVLTSGPPRGRDDLGDLGAPVLRVDLDPAAPPAADLGAPATVHDLIYGFFTSGSTGLPKCALNRHLGLLNRFLYMTRRFGGGHVVLQNSPHVFDSSDGDFARLLALLPDPRGPRWPALLAGLFTEAGALFAAERAARLAGELGVGWSAVDSTALDPYVRGLADQVAR